MRFRVLGPLEVMGDDGAARPVSSPSQRRLLAALLARSPEVVAVDTLVDALWGDDPPESAVATLRTHISRLRSQVGDALTTKGSGYQLVTGPRDTDASLFELLAREAADVSPARAVALLEEALELWRGPAYAEEADGASVRAEARRLDERRSQVAESRARMLLEAGREPEAVAAAEALVAGEPLREGAWAVLVEGLARTDRHAEALRAFQRAAAALADAGLEPSPRLRRAEQAVLDGAFGEQGSAPAPAGGAAPAERLAPATRRVLLRRPRHRPGAGCRPARHRPRRDAGGPRRRRQDPPGPRGRQGRGAAAGLGGEDRGAGPARRRRGRPGGGGGRARAGERAGVEPARRCERAGNLDVLVVLDNAEHVIGETARAVDLLLRGGPAVRVLTTSRERLGVDGEHVWTVAPLGAAGTAGARVPPLRRAGPGRGQ